MSHPFIQDGEPLCEAWRRTFRCIAHRSIKMLPEAIDPMVVP